MSWIFGAVKRKKRSSNTLSPPPTENSLFSFQNQNLIVNEGLLYDFCGRMMCRLPAHQATRWQHTKTIYQNNHMMIDGGYGELSRDQFIRRLLLLERSKPAHKISTDDLFAYFSMPMHPIFRSEILQKIKKAARRQLHHFWKRNLSASRNKVKHQIDLFVLNSRITNNDSQGQAYLDELITNYMPYLQKPYLDKLFAHYSKHKLSYRSFKHLIRHRRPKLAKLPLVMEGINHPFFLGEKGAQLYIKVKNILNAHYKDIRPYAFLDQNETFIRDIAESRTTLECDYYNNQKLRKKITSYYRYDMKDAAGWINDWITFELWRRSVNS